MISVITTAYNHQDTLDKAIRSVINQEDVAIEHIVIDDTETHNGMMKTFLSAFKQVTGEYIAFCDGDDYWTVSDKLRNQLIYMEAKPDCGLCVTRVFTKMNGELYEMTGDIDSINRSFTYDNFLKGTSCIHAQSYLIRKSDFDKYIDFEKFVNLGFGVWDLPIILELIRHTRFHCLDFYSAAFVKNAESVTNTQSRNRRIKLLYSYYRIKFYYIGKYGCKFSTLLYLAYRIMRDIYSITFKRWNR